MYILLGRISLDDYQLKIRALLRNFKFRDEIIRLEQGSFVYPELDLKLTVDPFKPEGLPQEWKPQTKATT